MFKVVLVGEPQENTTNLKGKGVKKTSLPLILLEGFATFLSSSPCNVLNFLKCVKLFSSMASKPITIRWIRTGS